MYRVYVLNFEHDGVAFKDIGGWETMTPKQVADEFEGADDAVLFLKQAGIEGTTIPKGRFKEFAEWLCDNLPDEVRRV